MATPTPVLSAVKVLVDHIVNESNVVIATHAQSAASAAFFIFSFW